MGFDDMELFSQIMKISFVHNLWSSFRLHILI